MHKFFLAFDIGATSGRTILGTLSESRLMLKELTRFPNNMIRLGCHYCWNIYSIYEHLLDGLKAAAKENVHISSIGIDTWGVDMVCIGRDGIILGLPYSYRDPHTEKAPAEFFHSIMSSEELYKTTGIQILNFNSLFQLFSMKRDSSSILEVTDKILFLPDALSYLLTGEMITEYTIASTSQFLNPYSKTIDKDMLKKMGLNPELFNEIIMPGKTIGTLKDEIAAECNLEKNIPVIAVAGHDTASAIAAVPAENEKFAYLSSGTWSLIGIETTYPVINKETFKFNITNEGGVSETIRLLKNITGMWIIESCLKEWKKEGYNYTYMDLANLVGSSPKFQSMIDPDDPSFTNPTSMTEAVAGFCRSTSQKIPENHSDFISCILESLALKYRYVLDKFKNFSDKEIDVLHIIGGGSKNSLLNQYAANSTGINVIAGPAEATAIGNIMVQAGAAWETKSLWEMRKLVRNSIETDMFYPSDRKIWETAYKKYFKIINNETRKNN